MGSYTNLAGNPSWEAVAKDSAVADVAQLRFACLADLPLEPGEALAVYRNKDVAEKAFYNVKDRLDMRCLNASTE